MTKPVDNIFIRLCDLPKDKFFVKINDKFNERLIKNIFNVYGSIQKLASKIGVSYSSVYKWKNGKQYPLLYIIRIMDLFNYKISILEKNLIQLKSGFNFKSHGGGMSNPIYPRFPIKSSKELARIIANIFGDGCLSNNKIQYYNQNDKLRERFKEDVTKIFGKVHFLEGINKTTPFVILPTPIAIILSNKIETFNSKLSRVPEFIKNSTKKIKAEFIRAFFDDEAYVKYKPPYRRIELALANKNFIGDMQSLLFDFGIKTSKIYNKTQRGFKAYYFYITGHNNIKTFYEKISFYHNPKFKKLEQMIKNPGRKSYAHGETEVLILIELNKKNCTSTQLMKKLNRKRCTINICLNKLEKKKKIRRNRRFKNTKEILWQII